MLITRVLDIMAIGFGMLEVKAGTERGRLRILRMAPITRIEHWFLVQELMPIPILIRFISLMEMEQVRKPSPHPSVVSIGNRIKVKGLVFLFFVFCCMLSASGNGFRLGSFLSPYTTICEGPELRRGLARKTRDDGFERRASQIVVCGIRNEDRIKT